MGRAPCCDKNGLKKGPWTPEEDQKLVDYIHNHGYGNWRTLPKNAGLQRCGKSCRLRWTNYLKPDIKRGRFSFEEEETIIQLHSILGNKWSAIAARLPGRTDNEIKNYWNTHIRKKLLRMGIDPVTHSPRLDLLDLSSILGSQMSNITSRIFTLQQQQQHIPLVNPELLKLVTSLMSSSSSHHHHHNILYPQNDQNDHFGHTPQTQLVQKNDHLLLHDQIQEFPTLEAAHDQWQSSNYGFTCSNNTTNNNEDCYGPVLPAYYNPAGSAYNNNNYGQEANFEFDTTMTTSVLSTSSSSPTTALNSNSTTTATTHLEDEPESYYCSDALKFELSDIWDVNYDFM